VKCTGNSGNSKGRDVIILMKPRRPYDWKQNPGGTANRSPPSTRKPAEKESLTQKTRKRRDVTPVSGGGEALEFHLIQSRPLGCAKERKTLGDGEKYARGRGKTSTGKKATHRGEGERRSAQKKQTNTSRTVLKSGGSEGKTKRGRSGLGWSRYLLPGWGQPGID